MREVQRLPHRTPQQEWRMLVIGVIGCLIAIALLLLACALADDREEKRRHDA